MVRRVRQASKTTTRSCTYAGLGCGLVLLLGLLAIATVYILATAKPRLPQEAAYSSEAIPSTFGEPTSTPNATDSAGLPSLPAPTAAPPLPTAPNLETQLRHAREVAHARQPVKVQLVVGQAELNSYLARHAGSRGISDVQVYLGEGTVVGTGRVNWGGRDLHLTVRARPVVSGGGVDLVVDEVAVGRLPAPAALRADAQRRLISALDEVTGRERFHAESVRVTPGVMIIDGWAGGAVQ